MPQTEKKQLDPQWEDKIHDYITPGHFDMLNTIEDKIQSCNDVLEEAGIGGISYRPQKSEIETYMENVAVLNRFINGLRADLDELIDQPLYEAFNQNATENLSRIHMSDFKTANTVGLTMDTTLYDETGASATITQLKEGLGFEDFLGSANRTCIESFAKLYKDDYELYKEIYGLDSLEEYLELLMAEGEFDHRENQPVKSFFSGLVGIIPFVKPVYELATGKEIITGEDLSDFEQGMNGVSLALDCFVVGKSVSALSDLTKPTLGQIIKLGGRTLAVDALTYGASYGTTVVLEDTNLPNELKLLLSLGVGLSVSHVSGKYLMKSADGNVISEVDEKTLKGSGAVDSKSIPSEIDLKLNELVDDIRINTNTKYPTGNAGAIITDIEGVTPEINSFSKINNSMQDISKLNHDYSYQFSENNRIFDTKIVDSNNIVNGPNAFDRAVDSEAKMLEDIAHQLGYNAKTVDTSITGNVYLATERAPCASCEYVIQQFEEMFPNVNVVVKYTK